MSFDGIFTYIMTQELKETIESGRITKIHQPFKHELVLQIRSRGQNYKLLLSAHPTYARVHLTNEAYDNPVEPPMFCMLLRKHLEGSIIETVRQVDLDRIIIIEAKGRNEIGDLSVKQLIIEIMGRHSNIILVDKKTNTIIDSIKHLPPSVNRHRTVLPGYEYIAPPSHGKINPLLVNEETILKKLDFNSGKLAEQLVQHFSGISPLFAKEAVFRAGIANRATLSKSFMAMVEDVKQGRIMPQIYYHDTKETFYVLPLTHLQGETKTFSTLSEMLDRFYFGKAERDRVKQQANDLERFIVNEKTKNEKKLKKLEQTLKDAEKAEQYRLYGELLTANLYAVKRGDKQVEVINYYDENGSTVTIPLDPQKSPSENAQSYFQKYQKAKNSVHIVQEQIERTRQEVDYFERLLQQMESASPKDVEEIREELIEEGYLRARQSKQAKKQKQGKIELERYVSSDGTEILVGKNNKQNDYLTNKLAHKDEIWLHTKDIPGSHVVIRSKNPSKQTILEAANLAAYFSKAKHSSSVPVDYTQIRYVKKPSGAKPGYVIYENQQTVYVTPNEDLVIQMKKTV
ncbi:putative ribosome quality control (RQC) complex YloA/Tae2 family protein [Anoxybacillus calidus]|jgi:predicted ribosome quality control (RQC) complex YloA/Tae2 family protein|uniref:Rqc2 homolog RqcH n=1 Tax=[Anoxybacillus] calidus TaxID=575178 RepID=A0A7W0BW12_9BACL|nr:NFACT RNA binding domain-containing protein [Anoxybacillus calidus]MBA2870746.1 putative ribosome quality control (RQC) complex YloA/Tae2 family protein [Anoxybacillus calidus]